MKRSAAILLTVSILAAACLAGCSTTDSGSSKTSGASSDTTVSAASDESITDESSTEEDSKAESSAQAAGEPVDASWFDDAVFVGDSVTLKLSYYCDDSDALGDTTFLCEGSLGYTNALWDIDHEDNVHPSYKGVKYTVDEGVKEINPNKIFIMLGMNDIGLYGIDGGIESMIELTDKVHANCPDAVIYIESVTPMVAGNSLGDLNNENIYAFDEKLKEVCADKGYKYLDITEAVSDENGDLVYEYCGDPPTDDNPDAMGLHFTDEGCAKWVEYLKGHVND